jgi:hypothetical protein|tara:strand:- start:6217 stop:6480 length:264 start_codon:yes stop_codon:yes gene_type:complete
MGKKHAKKRYFCVKYTLKPDKKFDELVTLSRKKIGPGKMQEYTVVLDLVNEEILKNELPNTEAITYEKMYQHYAQYYKDAIDSFVNA